ncbi:MBL fold metallo-hydrolase [Peribacillus kribbensis]|uniref:MBL fold metallo-hydrolase n=1 Tax=Peribacillus kribbensis TaxID=356658 RepID=UPI0003F933CC|nr:MBL fold metallo-hydrolase [Peribacillus kribbensis]
MFVSEGVSMLELKMQGMVIHPTLIWDETSAILIDTGMPGQLDDIKEAMEEAGVPFDHLKAVILTHQDFDHIGSLYEVVSQFSDIKVYAHELDKPYIEGDIPLLKVRKEMEDIINNSPKAKITDTLEDKEVLPYFGGIEVIFTPGHTPGHISLYLKKSKILVMGDASVSENGIMKGPVERVTPDKETALKSLAKFKEYDIEKVISYHGGLCEENVKEQLDGLASLSSK